MIRTFKHKGLGRFFEAGSQSGIHAQHAERLRLTLAQLNAATAPGNMALPGLDLHPLKGDRKGAWAVSVSGNWRIRFRFVGDGRSLVDGLQHVGGELAQPAHSV